MKDYWSIPGWRQVDLGYPCVAFDKPDGSNIRAEWSKKSGFYKYGSRNVLIDKSHPFLGEAITLFENTLADKVAKVFADTKGMPKFDSALVFMEFWGASSFAGQHVPSEPKNLTIIDVNLHKRGIVPSGDFVKWFGSLPIAGVLYEGAFNLPFIQDVKDGKYGQREGVVAKGSVPGKSVQHSMWFAKVKTKWWLDELRKRAGENIALQKILADNEREQGETDAKP